MTSNTSSIEKNVLRATKILEDQVDSVIDHLDTLNTTDLDTLRLKRINELKELENARKEWLRLGHGQYEELSEEKEFFDTIKRSECVIIHFHRTSTPRCAIVNKHLNELAKKHVEARFVSLNAEKCPFLANNLKIKTIPTIALIQKRVLVDKIIGFSQLGNTDDFSTELLEWRLAQNGIIHYDGDLSEPPNEKLSIKKSTKSIKSRYDDNDDELDIEEEGIPREFLIKSNMSAAHLTEEEEKELGL